MNANGHGTSDPNNPDPVVPFLIGAAVGGVAGAIVGTLLSQHTTHLIASLIAIADRRLRESERERLRFELLLQ
ncbi:MAG TPA: hypothetical protein VIL01_01630 [Thermomicrobiales bacterium]